MYCGYIHIKTKHKCTNMIGSAQISWSPVLMIWVQLTTWIGTKWSILRDNISLSTKTWTMWIVRNSSIISPIISPPNEPESVLHITIPPLDWSLIYVMAKQWREDPTLWDSDIFLVHCISLSNYLLGVEHGNICSGLPKRWWCLV